MSSGAETEASPGSSNNVLPHPAPLSEGALTTVNIWEGGAFTPGHWAPRPPAAIKGLVCPWLSTQARAHARAIFIMYL